jgi:hypothetical protein
MEECRSRLPKEEDGEATNGLILAYCAAACNREYCIAASKKLIRCVFAT